MVGQSAGHSCLHLHPACEDGLSPKPGSTRSGKINQSIMPKPNYQFEKRKRDMEKKAKKEEKKARKLEKANAPATPQDSGGQS